MAKVSEGDRDYTLEHNIGSAEALIQDVQRHLTRTALKNGASIETLNVMAEKLRRAAEYVLRLPERER